MRKIFFESATFFKIRSFVRSALEYVWTRKKIRYGIPLFFIAAALWFASAPSNFPEDSLVSIKEGMTLTQAARHLNEKGVIRSPLAFRIAVELVSKDEKVIFGDYFFKEPLTVFRVASHVTNGHFGLDPIKITIPEGASTKEAAMLFEKKFPDFSGNEFVRLAIKDEGYLFPDTYFFLPNAKAPHIHNEMRANFDAKIKTLGSAIEASGKSLPEIITMASLLEEEARSTETRKIISGILWKRIEIGMPLQVDAVFGYVIGKNTFTLTLDDLSLDSPYNTYKYNGLPPGPITNPGMDAILAALDPTPSSYLFFLSDLDGNTYYSKTFEEHKLKKAKYLTAR